MISQERVRATTATPRLLRCRQARVCGPVTGSRVCGGGVGRYGGPVVEITSHSMFRVNFEKRRGQLAAAIHDRGAPVGKPAAGLGVDYLGISPRASMRCFPALCRGLGTALSSSLVYGCKGSAMTCSLGAVSIS